MNRSHLFKFEENVPRSRDGRARGAGGRTDVILPTQDPNMDQIVDGTRTYEFRKYHIAASVKRVWFYRAAPHSRIEYFCEIAPATIRGPGRPLLKGDGVGIAEFNGSFDGEWKGFNYAYRILAVYKLKTPIKLQTLRDKYGFKLAPRSLVYLPGNVARDVDWEAVERVRAADGQQNRPMP